jgi:uncharacterized protein
MTDETVKNLMRKYKTPKHVIGHCEKVAYVADKIADAYKRNGINLDTENLNYACLLHDVLRIIDFHAGDEYLEMQNMLKEKYPNMDHSGAAYKMLTELGEPVIAKLIKKHEFEGILNKENQPFTLEEKIMTYADKRVLHEDIVSISERFEDGKRRYNPNNENQERELQIYDVYFQLEKELFEGLDINPEDIK